MGYGKAIVALGILVLGIGLIMGNDGGAGSTVGAIGILLIAVGAVVGLIMTAVDPLRQAQKDKMIAQQARDIEELNERTRTESETDT